MDKPTTEQTAWVFKKIIEASKFKGGCSFRGLIYDLMEYGHYAYSVLYEAGGMQIANMMFDLQRLPNEEEIKQIVADIALGYLPASKEEAIAEKISERIGGK